MKSWTVKLLLAVLVSLGWVNWFQVNGISLNRFQRNPRFYETRQTRFNQRSSQAHSTGAKRIQKNETFQMCENRLLSTIQMICLGYGPSHYIRSYPEPTNDVGVNNEEENYFEYEDGQRIKRAATSVYSNAVDECCKRNCSGPQMIKYCRHFPQVNSVPTITTRPPPSPNEKPSLLQFLITVLKGWYTTNGSSSASSSSSLDPSDPLARISDDEISYTNTDQLPKYVSLWQDDEGKEPKRRPTHKWSTRKPFKNPSKMTVGTEQPLFDYSEFSY